MKTLIVLWAISLVVLVVLAIALLFEDEIGINSNTVEKIGWTDILMGAPCGVLMLWGNRK